MRLNKRAGFTLVELLVVIAIIGVLVGLLLPAVQSAREAARRMQCGNNMKQMGLALLNYESAYKVLPPSRIALSNPTFEQSWQKMILPFMEQTPLYNLYNHNLSWFHQANVPATTQMIPSYMCPSAPGVDRDLPPVALYNDLGITYGTPVFGFSDYGSINAVRNGFVVSQGLPSLGRREVMGGLGRGPKGVKFSTITDGTSNTVIVAEGAGRPNFFLGGRRKSANPGSGVAFGLQFTKDGWGWADINGGFSIDGSNILGIQNSTTSSGATTVVGQCSMNCTNDSEMYSFHTGGVQGLRADGSVGFLSENMAGSALVALLTRDNGDITSEDN